MNQIKEITNWIDAAKQEKNNQNTANYVAFALSEVGEMVKTFSQNDFNLDALATRMEHISKRIRNGEYDHFMSAMSKEQKAKLMDDAFDTMWTSVGLMHMLGDAEGAFVEGTNSNYSKFENGVCSLDSTGKVVKGPSFFNPNFLPYIK